MTTEDTREVISAVSEAAEQNVATGVLLLCKEALITAIQDSRLHRGHLRLLAAVVSFMNSKTAKAWPGRASLSGCTGMPVKTVSNLLLELRNIGYLIADKEAVEAANNRKLTVYTFGNIDHETIRREITAFVTRVREGRLPEKVPPQRELSSSPTPAGIGSPVPTGTKSPAPAGTTQKFPPQRAEKSRQGGDSNSMKEQLKDDRRRGGYNWKEAYGLTDEWDAKLTPSGVVLPADTMAEWLRRFGGDQARLDLALIQILPYMEPNSQRPLLAQAAAQLARIAGEKLDRDQRYDKAVRKKAEPAAAGESAGDKIRRFAEEAEEKSRLKRGIRP